jgi:serine/threonine protein phosphatase PrpC
VSPEAALRQCLAESAARLTALAGLDPCLAGLGATTAGLRFSGRRVWAFNCGDCRVCRYRRGALELLARDRSEVWALRLQGLISRDEVRRHPRKHLVASAIQDHSPRLEVYARDLGLHWAEVFLACSDVPWENLAHEEIEERLAPPDPA